MKKLKLLLAVVFVAALAAIALAQNITLNGQTYNCGSGNFVINTTVDSAGDVTVTANCPTATPTPTPTGPPPTPTPTPTSTPTPPTPAPNGCATGAVQIPGPGAQPPEGIGTSLPGGVGITPYGENHYYIILPEAATEEVSVSTGTRSWINGENLGIMVSNTAQPTCSQIVPHGAYDQNLPPNSAPWYTVGTSTETLFLMRTFGAGTTLCVTICNETDIQGSLYAVYWGEL